VLPQTSIFRGFQILGGIPESQDYTIIIPTFEDECFTRLASADHLQVLFFVV
jgi:hypothetical protein